MSEQITIQVSERVARQAARTASQNQQRIEEVLAEWLERVISEIHVDELPDKEILALTELQLPERDEATLSELLSRNRDGTLDPGGRRQLDELMHIYQQGLLRKSQALRVAVKRGLREPLQP